MNEHVTNMCAHLLMCTIVSGDRKVMMIANKLAR